MGKLEHIYCTACGTLNAINDYFCVSCHQPLNLWQEDHQHYANHQAKPKEQGKAQNINNNQMDKTQAFSINDIDATLDDEVSKRLMTCPNLSCQALIDITRVNRQKSECPYCQKPINLNKKALKPKTFFIEFPWGREEITKTLFFGRDGQTSPYAHLLHPKYENISRSHAELIYTPQKVFLRDLGSTNGSFVNDQKLLLNEVIELNHGDRIKLAKTFTMLFIEYSE